jgi:pyruvate,water dikinase
MPGAGAAEPHTRPLPELRAGDAARFGGKSAGLGELLGAQIPVPPGFAVGAGAFAEFRQRSGLADRVATAVAAVRGDDVDTVAAASRLIGEAMRSAAVPGTVREEIEAAYGALAVRTGVSTPPVAVRSSALGEDSRQATFAGQQDTYLWVRGVDDVCSAVRDCWASLYSTEAISYRARLGSAGPQRPAMGVTVQLMVDAELSGVMFTCNPVSGDPSMVAINASWGLGLAVVGGEVTPDDLLVSKVTGEVVRERIGSKQVEYLPAAGHRGTVRVEVAPERQEVRCVDERTLNELVDLSRRIERHFGCHQDVEWAIARRRAGGGRGRLFILQSRPVTAVPKPKPATAPASALSLILSTFGAPPPQDG